MKKASLITGMKVMLVLAVLVIPSIVITSYTSGAQTQNGADVPAIPSHIGAPTDSSQSLNITASLTFSGPIRINNNSDLASKAASGSGTESDPYVIENYEINGSSRGYCIYIGNTTDYFVVRNCYLHDADGNSGKYFENSGLYLYNTSNGTIENNTILKNTNYGVYMYSSPSCTVNNSTIENSDRGIYILKSEDNIISNSTIANNSRNVWLDSCNNTSIFRNDLNFTNPNAYDGWLEILYCLNITISGNRNSPGVWIQDGKNISIKNNLFPNAGVLIQYCEYVYIMGNLLRSLVLNSDNTSITGNKLEAIDIWVSNNGSILNNEISNGKVYGIYLEQLVTNYTISYNNISHCGFGYPDEWIWYKSGICVSDRSNYNVISHNRIYDCKYEAILVSGPTKNNIFEFNNIYKTYFGIKLFSSQYNRINSNKISNISSYIGIFFEGALCNTLSNNSMSDCQIYFDLDGAYQWTCQTIYPNNTVNGKPVYYWKNRTSGTVPEGAGQVILANCSNVVVENQNFSDETVGVQVGFSSHCTISNVSLFDNRVRGVDCEYSDNITLKDSTISGSYWGATFCAANDNRIINNTFLNNEEALRICGMYDAPGDRNIISDNLFFNNGNGIDLYKSHKNVISGNRILDNTGTGLIFSSSYNNTAYNNTLSDNGLGISISGVKNRLWNNTLLHDSIFVSAGSMDMSTHEIYTNNTVNGKPVYYWKNLNSGTIPSDAGEVILANCTGITLSGLNLSDADVGIELGYTNSSTIKGNIIANNSRYGLYLWESSGNTIQQNEILNNSMYGLYMGNSLNNRFSGNRFVRDGIDIFGDSLEHWNTHTIDGTNTVNGKNIYYLKNRKGEIVPSGAGEIILVNCTDMTVKNQNMSDSDIGIEIAFSNLSHVSNSDISHNDIYGIYCTNSYNNTIYHNNFVNNTRQAYDDGKNLWNLSYPKGGNYWSDYAGADNYSGPGQNLTGSDGIGDSPYTAIGNGNSDIYPLMNPYDTTLPEIVSVSPADGSVNVNVSQPIVISFSESMNTSSLDYSCSPNPGGWTVSWNANGTTATLTHSVFDYNTTYTITINNAKDISDNPLKDTPVSFSFTTEKDTVAPTISIISPTDGQLLNSSQITVSWTASDSGSGLNHCEISMDGGAWENVGNDTEHTYMLLDGHHTVEVRAFDNANNYAVDSVSFNIDTTAPVIEITSSSDGHIFNSSSVTVEWKGNDTEINHYEVRLDSGAWLNVGNDTNHTFLSLEDGNHTVYVKAVDNASNENITSVSFIIDTAPPELRITAPLLHNGYVNTTDVTVSWQSSDNTSGIDHYEVWDRFVYYGKWIDVGNDTSYTFHNLTEGTYHSIYVKAIDRAGNERIKEITFTVDSEPPDILYFLTFGCTYRINCSNREQMFMWNSTDNTSGIEGYRIRLDNEPWRDIGMRKNYTFTNLTEGSHTAYLEVSDLSGNKVIKGVYFYTDLTPPHLSYVWPTGVGVPVNATVHLKFADNVSMCLLNSTEEVIWNRTRVNSTHYIFTPSENLSYGTIYHMHLLARDEEWNSLYYNWTFTTIGISTIMGTILDEKENPIPDATIIIDENINISTDENGFFSVEVPPGNHTLLISKDGYPDRMINVSTDSGEKKDLGDLNLAPMEGNRHMPLGFLWIISAIIFITITAILIYLFKLRKKQTYEEYPVEDEDAEEEDFY